MTLHFAHRLIDGTGLDAHEIDIARVEETMDCSIELRISGRDDIDLEEGPGLAAEDDREGNDQGERKQEIEDERRPVAQELEIPRVPDGEEPADAE